MRRVLIAALFVVTAASPAQASTLLLGDSLAIGMAPYIHVRHLQVDARIGRLTGEGMQRLASYPHLDRLMVSLFTNDYPEITGYLHHAIAVVKRKAHCVVWSTIHADGEDMRDANRLLRRSRSKFFQVVEWDRFVRRHPSLLAPDGIHATAAGYRARARLYIAALHRCPR